MHLVQYFCLPSECLEQSICSCKVLLISKRLSFDWSKGRFQIGRALGENHCHIIQMQWNIVPLKISLISYISPNTWNQLTEVVDGHDRRGSKKTRKKVCDGQAEDFWWEKIPPGEAKEKNKRVGEHCEKSSEEHYDQKNVQQSFFDLIFHTKYVFVTFGTIHTKFCSTFHLGQIAVNWDQISEKWKW